MKGNLIIYSILIYIFLPVSFTFELRNGKWSGLNENHTFDNEMNRASSSSQNCLCGRENVKETKRIVGGSTVNPPHRFPWMVALVRRIYNVDDFYCGGALISPYYVLTAAHCFTSQTVRNTRVALGAHDSTTSPEPVPISLLLAHPQYREDSLLYDIGLVKLRTPAQLGPYVNVLCLPASAVARPDEMATVVGWGLHKDPGGVPFEELQEVDLRILSLDACFVVHFPDFDKTTQICAGGQGRSPCAINKRIETRLDCSLRAESVGPRPLLIYLQFLTGTDYRYGTKLGHEYRRRNGTVTTILGHLIKTLLTTWNTNGIYLQATLASESYCQSLL
ncbi:venom peptide isomerase heavy chain [Trichonephila clavipes]|nr:venom peptide isomerase heavy chain [Trichonephila clavipes]